MNLFRISSYPTEQRSGMGFHAYQISQIKNLNIYYLTPKEIEKRLDTNNINLIEKDFFLQIRPRNINKITSIIFNLKRIFSILSFSFEGLKVLLSKKIDIVHIHSPMFILIGFFGFIMNKRVYITFHGTDFHRIKNAKWYRLFSGIFSKVFIISPDMKEALSNIHGKDKVILVQNGIDLDIYKNYNKNRDKQIVAVGSLKEEKGFKYLIDAFSNMIKENSILNNYKLVIAGEGLLRSSLEEQIILNNMENNIYLVGHKDRDEIIQLYNQSEIFILSSISEGFPKVILESMSCGCKIIATDVGSISQILKNTKFEIITSKDIIELKKAMITTIQNNYIYHQDILDKYTWDNVREIYKVEYEKEI